MSIVVVSGGGPWPRRRGCGPAGGLIQTAEGASMRLGRPWTKRSGCCEAAGGDDAMAGIEDLLGPAVVHLGRSQIGDAGMVVLVVVPGEEPLAEEAPLLDRAEAAGELRAVLQGLELRLREGVVVGHVGPAVG